MNNALELLPKKRKLELQTSFNKIALMADEVITPQAHDAFSDYAVNNWPATHAHLFGRVGYTVCTAATLTAGANTAWRNACEHAWTSEHELALLLKFGGCHNKKAALIYGLLSEIRSGKRLLGHPVHDMGMAPVNRANDHPNDWVVWHAARLRLSGYPGMGWKLATMCLAQFCPFECPLLIVDTWFAKNGWYNINPNNALEYRAAENHWIALCEDNGWTVAIAREIFWDRHGQRRFADKDNGYWMGVACMEQKTPLVDFLRDKPYPM